jgi:hypothetical protein
MSVRVVIDISEDELAEVAKDSALALAFVNAAYGMKENHKLGKGVTISASTDVQVSGNVESYGVHVCDYNFEFGYGRYREDQGSVAITGENGSNGQVPIRKAMQLAPIK